MSSFLDQYKRQPKLFIDLPSKGASYDESVIQDQQYTQLPVFGMNTMDEIMIKTPDALFSGEATAEIIKSCVPMIKDPWKIIGFDLDYILLAIRMATYGDKMPVSSNCPKCSTQNDNEVMLTKMLEKIDTAQLETSVTIKDLTFNLQPLTYKRTTDISQKHFTLQKQLASIEVKEQPETDKQPHREQLLKAMGDLNIELTLAHIKSITNGQDEETDAKVIAQFIVDNDADFYKEIQAGVQRMNVNWNNDVLDIKCSNEECGHEYKSQLNVDYSSFFGTRSLRSRNLIS